MNLFKELKKGFNSLSPSSWDDLSPHRRRRRVHTTPPLPQRPVSPPPRLPIQRTFEEVNEKTLKKSKSLQDLDKAFGLFPRAISKSE